ncbi:uncharacterized protein LOC110188318 [Drosophila serrata]|uniref:uncharacterized protein LOC110188318 n=1 Tax=Drosophila serrata TaxID=7274 RepID=UPI000A1CFBF7|nr:uncharacterized protein LOC110188318 [Drosophila serrata]
MPHSKLHLPAVVGLFLLLTFGTTTPTTALPTDTLNNKTIVVHTPLQNYDQPTIRDYEECQANRDQCLSVCDDDVSCIEECPVCPELYEKPLMVQGVNDTDVVAPPQTPMNTTNIIRLTNEINNIIEHQIQNRNQVNVQVQQNVSQVGGRFGLGYSDQGSCCYVVRQDRECEKKGSEGCREKSRQRVCGERCQARVMLAKLVVQCDAENPDNCHETIEYVPRRRRVHPRRQNQPCQYLGNNWPYFTCGQGQGQGQDQEPADTPRVKRSTCQQCLNMPYGYILQNGLPPQCAGCFQGFGAPMMPMYSIPYIYNPFVPTPPGYPGHYPGYNNGNHNGNQNGNDNDVTGSGDDGFVVCDDDDIEKCLNDKYGSLEMAPEKPQEDPDYNVEAQRRRRRQSGRHFVRSIYSKRNRKDN